MKRIPLTQDEFALVDNVDYERLNRHKWRCQKNYSSGGNLLMYAVRQVRISPPSNGYSGKRIFFSMHREILGLNKGDKKEVDHIDTNGLNNQKCNLRICSRSQNFQNQRRAQSKKSSIYKGVFKHRNSWVASIFDRGKPIYLGIFKSEIEAAIVYNIEAEILFGEYARLNEL